jgi:hypothetical protein
VWYLSFCAESKLLAEVMTEQCTEAKLAEPSQASAVGFSSSNGVVGWNMPAVLSSRDVCLNLYYDLDTGQVKSSIYAGASHAQVQLRTNVEHGRVVECAQHSHIKFKSDGTSRAWEVLIGTVELPKSLKSASNYPTVRTTTKCLSLDGQSNAEQSLSFFKPNVAVLSRQSGVLSHQNDQGGRDSVASLCASAIFLWYCGLIKCQHCRSDDGTTSRRPYQT